MLLLKYDKLMENSICEFCQKTYKTKYSCFKHQKICKFKINNQNYNEIIKQRDLQIDKLEQEFNKYKIEKENEIKFLKELLEKQINKPTTTIIKSQTNNENCTINNKLKQIVSNLDPVDFEEIKESMEKFTKEYIDKGLEGFVYFLCDHPCKNKIVTTDNARNTIAYRTKKQEFIRDPEANHLINRSLRENADTIIEKSRERNTYWKEQFDEELQSEFQTKEVEGIKNTDNLIKGAKNAKKNIRVRTKDVSELLKQVGNENVYTTII